MTFLVIVPPSNDKHGEQDPYSGDGYGPIPAFKTDIDELKWLCVQGIEKQRLLDNLRKKGAMAYPPANAFFAGDKPIPKLAHEVQKPEMNRRWNNLKDKQLPLQRKAIEMAERERKTQREKQNDRRKRKAEEDLESEQQRKRFAAATPYISSRMAEKMAQLGAQRKKLQDKQLEANAAMKATFGDSQGVSIEVYRQLQKEEAAKVEEALQKKNRERALAGIPLIQRTGELDVDTIDILFKMQEEEAEEDAKRTQGKGKGAQARKRGTPQTRGAPKTRAQQDQVEGQ